MSTAQPAFVIAGAGLAGAAAAEALRREGFDGRLVLMGEEAERPYDRPALSKDYLQGKSNVAGRATPYDHVPYFFSDQYDMGMEYSGYAGRGRYDEVVFRGDVAKGEFIAFWMGAGVLAGMNVNIWDATDAIQTLVRAGRPVNPAQLANPAVPLEDLGGGTLEGAP